MSDTTTAMDAQPTPGLRPTLMMVGQADASEDAGGCCGGGCCAL